MKHIILAVLALTTVFSASANPHKHKIKQKIVSVSMQRTGCYGHCPAYIIALDKDGMATYTAMRFNADSGIFVKNLGSKKTKEIFGQFVEKRIDTCQDKYENRIPDLPGLIFTIKYTSQTKTIQNANFGPLVLKQIADVMDGIMGKKTDETWKRPSNKQ